MLPDDDILFRHCLIHRSSRPWYALWVSLGVGAPGSTRASHHAARQTLLGAPTELSGR